MASVKVPLKGNQVVVLKNGQVGIIVEFNGIPTYIITKCYVRKLSSYTPSGKCSNDNYSIKEIYDGSPIACADEVFKAKFKVEDLKRLK